MARMAPNKCLDEHATVAAVVQLLSSTTHHAFALVEPGYGAGRFIGLITRRRLCTLLAEGCYSVAGAEVDPPLPTTDTMAAAYPHFPAIETVITALPEVAFEQRVLGLRAMSSPSNYTVQAAAPLGRALHLFRSMGLRHLPVLGAQ